jgi:filamentous hemagglutinin family protein
VFFCSVALFFICENSPSLAQIPANTLPTGGTVTSGSAVIAQNNNTLNINQSSQKAIINWSTFDVGSAATVNFNQPNSQASTLNRVNSASKSMIDGAVNSNGTVIFVNPNGIVFGKGAQVNTGSIVATTMNITDQEYLSENNKKIFSGSAKGKIVNNGTITANNIDGYIALMAPQVKNQGVVIANMSGNNSIALVSGEKVTLTFQGERLLNVNVDASTIKSLIKNKNLIQTNGGQVIIAANAASDLKSSVLVNTGTVSADGLNVKGGRIYLTASTIKQQGIVTASAKSNSSSTRVEGGTIVAQANTIKLKSGSQTLATGDNGGGVITLSAAKLVNVKANAVVDASANTSGNGGSINIDAPTVKVMGKLFANGGNLFGNGGSINIIANDFVTAASSVIKAGSQVTNGVAGNLSISMPNINITQVFASLISSALNTTNVILNALSEVYFTLANSASSNAAIINLLQGVVIYKTTSNRTGLQLNAEGSIYVAGQVVADEGSLLDVVLSGNNTISINELAKLVASSVTINSKQGEVDLNGASLTSAGGNINITAKGDINIVNLNVVASNPIDGGEIIIASSNGIVNLQQSFIQTNGGVGRGGTISITANQDVAVLNTNVLANGGENGGQVVIVSEGGDVNLNQALVQTNGSTGRGGTILISGANQTLISGTEINAKGLIQGGIIKIGYDALNHTIPFSNFTSLDNNTILNAESLIGTASGGFIETSGHILNPLATIKAGEGGTWLLDPNNISIVDDSTPEMGDIYSTTYTSTINSVIRASRINASLNAGTSVTITTGSGGTSAGDIRVIAAISKTLGGNATLTLTANNNITIYKSISSSSNALDINLNSSASATTGIGTILYAGLNSNGGNITIGTSSSNGNLAVGGDITINSGAGAVTINGTVTGVAQVLYETTTTSRVGGSILYTTGFGTGGSDAAATFGSAISRITYRMEVKYLGTIYYADVSFDAWSGAVVGSGNNGLRIPDLVNTAVLRKTVTNLVVKSNQTSGISSRASAVSVGSGKTGLLELWYWDYGTTGGNSSIYDYADTPSNNGNYGSFQVHDQATGATILAWNRHYDSFPETGIGSSTSGHTDWTFTGGSGTSLGNTDWKLQIGVNENSSKLNINSGAASEVKGAISNLSTFTKSGAGTLTLSGTNTYTGSTIISAGTLAITSNNALGTNAAGTTIASGATLDLQNITYSTTETLTVNGGTVKTSTGTSSFAGGVTLGANSTVDVTGTQLTISGVITDGASTYGLTKTGSGILVLSNTNTYDGTTTISAGTLVLQNNVPNPTSKTFAGTGALRIESSDNSFTSAFTTSGWNFGSTLASLVIGKSNNAANITLASTTTIAGPIGTLIE